MSLKPAFVYYRVSSKAQNLEDQKHACERAALAHGYELAGDDSAWWTLAGMLTATVLLHSAGLAAGWALRHRHAE